MGNSRCIYGSDVCQLNPGPTDVQRAIWRRHHKAGTSPGNPKWYRAPALPTMAKPWAGQRPVYPALPSGADWLKKHRKGGSAPDPFHAARGAESTADYVARYNKAVGLRPA